MLVSGSQNCQQREHVYLASSLLHSEPGNNRPVPRLALPCDQKIRDAPEVYHKRTVSLFRVTQLRSIFSMEHLLFTWGERAVGVSIVGEKIALGVHSVLLSAGLRRRRR